LDVGHLHRVHAPANALPRRRLAGRWIFVVRPEATRLQAKPMIAAVMITDAIDSVLITTAGSGMPECASRLRMPVSGWSATVSAAGAGIRGRPYCGSGGALMKTPLRTGPLAR